MTSMLTKKLYKCIAVCVNQDFRQVFVHLQPSSTVETVLKGKRAWEYFTLSHGITLKVHHADKDIFEAKGWV